MKKSYNYSGGLLYPTYAMRNINIIYSATARCSGSRSVALCSEDVHRADCNALTLTQKHSHKKKMNIILSIYRQQK